MIFHKADTHMHTSYSDGMASPEALVDYVVAKTDLKVIAITDHDTADGALVARDYAGRMGYDLDVVIGQEVTTEQGDILGLFVRHTLPQFSTAVDAIDAIHRQGGLAIAAHPFSRWATWGQMHGVGKRLLTLPLDGVEVRNGFPLNLISNRITARANQRRTRPLSRLGGSDSHSVYTIGQPHTLFPGSSASDLRTAIMRGTTLPSGPLWTPWSLLRILPDLAKHGFPSSSAQKETLSANVTAVVE